MAWKRFGRDGWMNLETWSRYGWFFPETAELDRHWPVYLGGDSAAGSAAIGKQSDPVPRYRFFYGYSLSC